MHWNKESIIAALAEVFADIPPGSPMPRSRYQARYEEMVESGFALPGWRTVARHFGTTRAGLEAAGITVSVPHTAWTKRDKRLFREMYGHWSYAQIGKSLKRSEAAVQSFALRSEANLESGNHMTLGEVANYLHVPRCRVRKAIENGHLPAVYYISRRRWTIGRDDVDAIKHLIVGPHKTWRSHNARPAAVS